MQKLIEIDSKRGPSLAKNLERSLMAIPLVAHEALTTAYINDVDGLGVFAQQLMGFGRKGDVFLGISTSGNSKNVMNATVVARASGIKVIGLTGISGGELAEVADVAIKVPETETYMIQELHLPVYHCLSKATRPVNSRLDKRKLVEAGFMPLPTWQDAVSRYLKEAQL